MFSIIIFSNIILLNNNFTLKNMEIFMRRSHFFLLGFFVLAFSILSYFSFSELNAAKKIIKIGFLAPLTGGAASYGLSIKRGVDLAGNEPCISSQ